MPDTEYDQPKPPTGVKNPDPRTSGKIFTIYVCTSCGEHNPGANDRDFCGKCPGRVAPLRVAAVEGYVPAVQLREIEERLYDRLAKSEARAKATENACIRLRRVEAACAHSEAWGGSVPDEHALAHIAAIVWSDRPICEDTPTHCRCGRPWDYLAGRPSICNHCDRLRPRFEGDYTAKRECPRCHGEGAGPRDGDAGSQVQCPDCGGSGLVLRASEPGARGSSRG